MVLHAKCWRRTLCYFRGDSEQTLKATVEMLFLRNTCMQLLVFRSVTLVYSVLFNH